MIRITKVASLISIVYYFSSRRRKSSLDAEEQMVIEDEMDEHMAAMVLTSLSCSPTSPSFPAGFTEKG